MNKTTEALKLAEEALNAMLTHMGMDEDEWTKPTFDQSRKTLAAIREAKAELEKQEPVAEVVLREQRVGFGRAEKRKDIKFLRDVEVGADLYAAPADAKSIRAEERQRCIEAIRKAHHKELCDVWDCIEVIKELE